MVPLPEPDRRSIIVLSHDGQLLDLLTRLFEARGFAVALAATVGQALAHLGSEREFDVVVAEWDSAYAGGGEVYRWVLERRFDLRDRFVFLTEDPPADFDRVVAGRCLTVRPRETAEVVRLVVATAARVTRPAELAADWSAGGPSLLLADDDPMLLAAMADLLREAGFAVTAVDSGKAAIAALDRDEHDVVLVEWHMANGTGAQVFQWVVTFRPWLVDRVAFLIERGEERQAVEAPGRPSFWKGADSVELIAGLKRIAGR